MSLLTGATVCLRVVDSDVADEPYRVSNFGTLPGYGDKKHFCSFCGASGEDTPLMCGVSGNICPGCVERNKEWASEYRK